MNYLTHQLLNAEEIDFIKKELEKENQDWEDGKNTAGSHASKVKNNLQLKRKSDVSIKLSLLVKQKILNDGRTYLKQPSNFWLLNRSLSSMRSVKNRRSNISSRSSIGSDEEEGSASAMSVCQLGFRVCEHTAVLLPPFGWIVLTIPRLTSSYVI